MFCITYDTTCYADPQRAFDSFMRQLRELFSPVLRVRKNKRIVSHPQLICDLTQLAKPVIHT